VVDLIGEDGLIHRLAVVHRDPARAEAAAQLQRRYPVLDPQGKHRIAEILRRGQSWFDAEVSETRLAAEARDAEHLQLLRELGFASEMIVLLTARGRTLGALTLVRANREGRYEAADLALAEELARRAAIAVDNARLYEAEQRARQTAEQIAQRIASLQAITAKLAKALTPAEIIQIIFDDGLAAIGASGSVFALLTDGQDEFEIVNSTGYPAEAVAPGRHFPVKAGIPIADVIQSGQPLFLSTRAAAAALYPDIMAAGKSNDQAWAVLPLLGQRQAIGAVTISFAEARAFSPEEQEFILTVTQQCAQALERAQLYEIEQQARLEAEANQQRLALLAEMRERSRLAQELHDTVAQVLGYLNLKIAMANTLLADNRLDALKANLQELKGVIAETYTDVREEIFNLRSAGFEDLSFLELLGRYIDKYRRFYNLEIQLLQEAEPELFEFPGEMTSQVVRTIQEALINVRKHAQVSAAIIRLSREGPYLRISVEDEGQGFDLAKIKDKAGSFGLLIMRERVESAGGSLEVDSAPGRGTRVTLRFRQA
jgi:signal transduction histidine kinase